MRYCLRHHALTLAIGLLLAVIVSWTPLHGADQPSGGGTGILFLQLHIGKDGVSFVDSEVVPGALKKRRADAQNTVSGIHYEAKSTSGVIVASGTLDNPLIRRIEYEDPTQPGLLKSKVIELDEADFVLRLGFREDIESISFYETEKGDSNLGTSSSRKHLGTVAIDPRSGGEE